MVKTYQKLLSVIFKESHNVLTQKIKRDLVLFFIIETEILGPLKVPRLKIRLSQPN